MRIVVDTSVLVAARRSSLGASRLLLEEWLGGAVEAAVTVALFLEYEAVLKRPEHLAGPVSLVDELLDAIASVSVPIESRFSWRPQLRDPDDDFVLDAAMNAGASAIVTFNQADFSPQAQHLGLALLTPAQFLRTMK